ncbi:hypothetical protein CDAR_503851 [Caerostris darwini]|uniref:Uncharacterized protein n=1 Tax=Caerostris darwini TaxID=1538125 RepID=A0AAV4PG01_9ARAC|nr:hypothetical protein CDAR_503851 [Caerostris darwini]
MSKTSGSHNFGNSIFCKDNVTMLTTCFFFPNPKIVHPNKISTADKPDVNTSILPVKMLPSTPAPRRILIGGVSLPTSVNTMPWEASLLSKFLSRILGKVEQIFG